MAYKINSFNYLHIRNSIFKNGVATTSKAYGIDKTTLRTVKNFATFEEYREFITKKSREQYERRIKRQRERMFGNGVHFDGNIILNKPKEEPKEVPFETDPELGRAKTIVTEVEEHETPKDLDIGERIERGEYVHLWNDQDDKPVADTSTNTFVEYKEPEVRGRRGSLPLFNEEKLNIALEMARNGELKGDIAKKLGYYHASNLTYHISKRPEWADAFKRALAEGQEQYRKNLGKRIGGNADRMEKMRASSNAIRAAIQAERPTVDKSLTFTRNKPAEKGELTAYEKGLLTGAEKMGMTLDEYKQWRVNKLKATRWPDKVKDATPSESYKDLVERQNKEAEDAKNSKDDKIEVEERNEGVKAGQKAEPVVATPVVDRPREGARDGGETVNTDKPADTQLGTDVSDTTANEADNRNLPEIPRLPKASRFATYTYREEKSIPESTASDLCEEKREGEVAVPRDAEATPKHCTCTCSKTSPFAHGVNSLLESIGSAIKVIAIGVLVLLFALAAQMVINAYNSSQIKINPSTCEYTSASGIEMVKCSTI